MNRSRFSPSPVARPWRAALLVLGVILGGFALAQPALAQHWGPLSSSYSGHVRVRGQGNFYNSASAYARSVISVTDTMNDGNNVYGRTAFQFYRLPTGSNQATWITSASKSTPEHSGAGTTWTHTLQVNLRWDADRARGVSVACAQMGWPVPDSCSANAYVTFSY